MHLLGMTLFFPNNSIDFVFFRRLRKKIKANCWFLQRTSWISCEMFTIRHLNTNDQILKTVAMHGSPWRCIRLSLLLDNLCNICFLPWVGKMINIDLFRRKSFGCLTRVVHKSSWAKLKPRHATPLKEINIGKNTTSSSEMKWNIYFTLLTQHTNGFVSNSVYK